MPDIDIGMLDGVKLKDCDRYSNIYDINLLNPSSRIKKLKGGVGGTYDGFIIVDERFKQFCEIERYLNLEFMPILNSIGFYWFKVYNIVVYDAEARGTRFLNYHTDYKGYEEIIGANPVYLKSKEPLADSFYRTDICFGSYAGKMPLYLVGCETKEKLEANGFGEINFEEILDEYESN